MDRPPKPKSNCLCVDAPCCTGVGFMCFHRPRALKAQKSKRWSSSLATETHRSNGNSSMLDDTTNLMPNPPAKMRPSCTHADYQQKQALAVAVATTAAAEVAVVAAEAASRVAKLAASQSLKEKRSLHAQTVAAIRIQSAFRGHMVRKALRIASQDGLLRLHALVHGHHGHTQSKATMQTMQAFVRAQQYAFKNRQWKHQVWAKRTAGKERCHETVIAPTINKDLRLSGKHYHDWNKSTKTIEEIEDRQEAKRKATLKRERALAYDTFLHQQFTNKMAMHPSKESGLSWNWLERWMATRHPGCQKSCHQNKLTETARLSTRVRAEKRLLPSKSLIRQAGHQSSSSASSNAGDDVLSVASFSGTPRYMAGTESTRARIRAHSAPKQRLGTCTSSSLLQNLPNQPNLHAFHSFCCSRHVAHMAHYELYQSSSSIES